METHGNRWNKLEATVLYKAWARLTPTLTHVVTYKLVTSGAEDDAMSVLLQVNIYQLRAKARGTEHCIYVLLQNATARAPYGLYTNFRLWPQLTLCMLLQQAALLYRAALLYPLPS